MQAHFHDAIYTPWTALDSIKVGSVPESGKSPYKYVLVEADDKPLLRIEIYPDIGDEAFAFQDALIWQNFVVIGIGHKVHLIPLSEGKPKAVDLGCYFGYLYPQDKLLLVASARQLHCIDLDGNVRWSTELLGLDGVLVDRLEGDVVHGEGEWDPPGGWRPYQVSVVTGQRL